MSTSFWDRCIAALADFGPAAAVGVTIVLAGGLLLSRAQKSPEARRRLGIWTAIGAAGYLLLAVPPMPRLLPDRVASHRVAVTDGDLQEGRESRDRTAREGVHERAMPTAARVPGAELASSQSTVGPGTAGPGTAEPGTAEPGTGKTPAMPDCERLEPPLAAAATDPAPNPTPSGSSGPDSSGPPEPAAGLAGPSTSTGTQQRSTPKPAAPLWASALAVAAGAAAFLLLVHYVVGAWRLRRIVRRARPAAAAATTGVRLPPRTRVLVARDAGRPFCAGWLHPVVVLPPAIEDRPDACAAVLRHEAAHLFGRDPLVQMLFAVLALPLALHPLFWWLRATVRFDSERLADERAAAAGTCRTDYVRDLLDLVDVTAADPVRGAATMAVFHRPSTFYRRIQMLLSTDSTITPVSRRGRAFQALTMGLLVTTAALTFGVPTAAQDPGTGAQKARLEAERAVLRAEIRALRTQLEAMKEQMDRDAARAPGLTTGPVHDRYGRQVADGYRRSLELQSPPAAKSPSALTDRRLPGQNPTAPRPPGAPGMTADASPLAAPRDRADAAPPPPQPPAAVFQDTTGDGLPDRRLFPAGQAPLPAGPGAMPADPRPSGGWTSTPGLPATPRTHIARTNAPDRVASNAAPRARATSTEEIVSLTSKLIDLEADLQITRVERDEAKQLAAKGLMSRTEARTLDLRYEHVQRKRAILRGLLEGEIEATQLEVRWLEQQRERAGKDDKVQYEIGLHRAMSRLRALEIAK